MKRVLAGLAGAASLALALLYGFEARARRWFPYEPLMAARRAVSSRGSAARGDSRLAARDAVGKLTQLPYLQGYHPATNRQGVTIYDPARAADGWNLCLSAHAAQADLLDMRGRLHHRWSYEARRIWPTLAPAAERSEHDDYWRRALLLPGGDLVVIWEYIGMARLDSASHLKWAIANRANHDLAVDREGRLYTLTREIGILPDVNPDAPVFDDFVTVLSPGGELVEKISLLRAFEDSDYAPALAFRKDSGDILHANSVQVLDGALAARNPAFRDGNLLVSIHELGIVAVLDPRSKRIVWALSGVWRAQHTPRLLDTGRLLLFDNAGSMQVGRSRILEIDPATQQIAWRYGDGDAERFSSDTHGTVQRLGNGDTLVVESNNGRAFEVTPDRQIVWEYVNPHRVGATKELVATLTQVERLDKSLAIDWAKVPPEAR